MVTLPRVTIEVMEVWTMECPYCLHDQDAPFNQANPMQPMTVECNECSGKFIAEHGDND